MTAVTSTDSNAAKTYMTYWICALLVLAMATVYWPVMGCEFTAFDDPQYVYTNSHVLNGLSWSGLVWAFTHYQVNWHPITWLSHMLDVQLYGLKAGGHHATSMLFHAANVMLVFLWLKRLTEALWRSAFVAALFGLHPLHVESVAWVAERKDVLSTFFFLLSLMAYTRYVRKVEAGSQKPEMGSPASIPFLHLPAYWWSLFFFAFGLMSKPMVVTLPFVLLLLDYWPLQRMRNWEFGIRNFKILLVEKTPFFALSAISCAVTFIAQQSGKAVMPVASLSAEARIENSLIAYTGYLGKAFWPDSLAAFYPIHTPIDTNAAIAAVIGLLLISGIIFIFRRQRPYLATGWLWYLGTLVPVIGLVQVGSQSMADRYTYIPLIGIFIAITWLAAEISMAWPYRRLLLATFSILILATCWRLTATQVRYWKNGETLARHALAVTSENSTMQMVLGDALVEQGKVEEAGQHFAEALRICPDNVPAQGDLALALASQGRYDEAVDNCRAALKSKPDEPKIHYIFANILFTQGKFSEAIAEYQAVLKIDPDRLFALNDLAWLLATAPETRFRDGTEAVRLAERACRLSNYQATLYVGTLAAAYAEAGRFDDAVKTAQKAITLATAAKNDNLIQKNRELLGLYQQKKAYHEPVGY